MVPEATAAATTSAAPGRALVELGEVALGPMPGQALLPVKYTSKPPLSFHLLQHPRPAQPILPGSFWSSPASPPPLPAAHRGVGFKRSPKHTTPCINPSVASCRTWTKTQAPSVGSQQALPNSSISSLLPGAGSATLASFLFLRRTSCSWYLEASSHRASVASASYSCFYCKDLSLEGKMGSSHLSPLFVYFPALFIYLVTNCLLSTCYVPGTVQALG